MLRVFLLSVACCVFLVPKQSGAWGKRGHYIVGQSAALLLGRSSETLKSQKWIQDHSFDLGYYNNVPDLVWKSVPEVYKVEWTEHFIDLEIYDREIEKLKLQGKTVQWLAERNEFLKQFDKLDATAGRALWRISELSQKLFQIQKDLNELDAKFKSEKSAADADKKAQQNQKFSLQEQWLVTAGVMGHYVADLSQPLHVTENYDGQMTEQKGIHSFYEDRVVDELTPQLEAKVLESALKRWPAFKKKNENLSTFDLVLQMSRETNKLTSSLLSQDKKWGRDLSKVKEKYRPFIQDQLTTGTLYLALIWSKSMDWSYDGSKFYNFKGQPSYIEPVKESKTP
jgi:hypothetical protein